MNIDIRSAECLHGMHSSCTYEDCACTCHMDEIDDDDDYEHCSECGAGFGDEHDFDCSHFGEDDDYADGEE